MKKLLACIDASVYATSVSDFAAWAAIRLDASVEILHVIQRNDAVSARHDISGAIGLGAKSSLLEELVSIEEAQGKLARQQGQLLIEAAQARIKDAGIANTTTVHRHGGIVETVIEREADADLVIIGKRGASANFAKGHLGSKVERVVRESIRPVLVASRAFAAPTRALLAFDGGDSARKAADFLATSPLLEGIELHVVAAGHAAKHLDWAREKLPGATVTSVDGSPEDAIPAYAESHKIDLLVMGAYGHSPLRQLVVGSTTTAMIRACHIPVLLFR